MNKDNSRESQVSMKMNTYVSQLPWVKTSEDALRERAHNWALSETEDLSCEDDRVLAELGHRFEYLYVRGARDFLSLPIAERLTEEEAKNIRGTYAYALKRALENTGNREYLYGYMEALRNVFGCNFFGSPEEVVKSIIDANVDVLKRIKEKGD
ncbi:MAG: hypothetical protein K1W14_06475 [Muribaculaceae bacterium]